MSFSLSTAPQQLISIWANISAHMDIVGFVAKIGTIIKDLERFVFLCYNSNDEIEGWEIL